MLQKVLTFIYFLLYCIHDTRNIGSTRPVHIDLINFTSQHRDLVEWFPDAIKGQSLLGVGGNSLTITHTGKVCIVSSYQTDILTLLIRTQ